MKKIFTFLTEIIITWIMFFNPTTSSCDFSDIDPELFYKYADTTTRQDANESIYYDGPMAYLCTNCIQPTNNPEVFSDPNEAFKYLQWVNNIVSAGAITTDTSRNPEYVYYTTPATPDQTDYPDKKLYDMLQIAAAGLWSQACSEITENENTNEGKFFSGIKYDGTEYHFSGMGATAGAFLYFADATKICTYECDGIHGSTVRQDGDASSYYMDTKYNGGAPDGSSGNPKHSAILRLETTVNKYPWGAPLNMSTIEHNFNTQTTIQTTLSTYVNVRVASARKPSTCDKQEHVYCYMFASPQLDPSKMHAKNLDLRTADQACKININTYAMDETGAYTFTTDCNMDGS